MTSKSTVFHTDGWLKVLENTYGYDMSRLVVRRNDSIMGALPVARLKSRVFGDRYVSLPFSDYAGPLTDSEAVLTSLLDYADKQMDSTEYLEFHLLDR